MDYKKIKYRVSRVGAHDKRELIEATGQDYVPALVDGKQIITYSNIPDYLETISPDPTIYPNNAKGMAKAIENWAHYRLEDIVWQYSVPDMPKTFRDDMERWVFVEMQEIKRGPLEALETNRPKLKVQMLQHFQILEDMLGDHKFLIGEEPSLGDFAVFGALSPLTYSGSSIPSEFSRLTTWQQTVEKI
jgi:glutathione S-transferase